MTFEATGTRREGATCCSVSVRADPLNLTTCSRNMGASKTFCHASLPARPRGTPLGNNLHRQTQGNKLSGVCRLGTAAFFNHRTAQQVIGKFWQLFVFHRPDNMRIHARKIRA